MGILVKLIGSGIGLASEAIHHHKASKSPARQPDAGESSSAAAARAPVSDYDNEAPPQYAEVSESHADILIASGKAVPVNEKEAEKIKREEHEIDSASDEEGDEEVWELDEAAHAAAPTTPMEEGPAKTQDQLVDEFMRSHPPPAYTPSEAGRARGQLPCPVIIPQRRPRDKKRGFVRAYAPVLNDCGIDEATFLDFLKSFHAACKADPWLQVVNMAAMAAGFVPNPIAMGVTIAVQFAVGVAMEVQRRTRTNGFLDRMNKEFFEPRGLYCLIMTYKPDSSAAHARIDINQTISNYMEPASSKGRQTLRNMRMSSGKTYGELEMPEAAPLIFPALEALAASPSEGAAQTTSKLKDSQKFVADYFDRRAQAKYAGESPGSSLAHMGEEKKFASRYADPNHPANSGSLVALLTGGAINPRARKQQRREKRAIRRGRAPRQKKGGIIKRILKADVLYLMIVNMPTEAELQAGKDAVANEKGPVQ